MAVPAVAMPNSPGVPAYEHPISNEYQLILKPCFICPQPFGANLPFQKLLLRYKYQKVRIADEKLHQLETSVVIHSTQPVKITKTFGKIAWNLEPSLSLVQKLFLPKALPPLRFELDDFCGDGELEHYLPKPTFYLCQLRVLESSENISRKSVCRQLDPESFPS